MKNIYKLMSALILVGMMSSCELFEAPNDTENITELLITFPEIALNGDPYVTVDVGGDFDDPGAAAAAGVVDISDQVVVNSGVDFNTAGVYTISYTITTTNELGEESTRVTTRFVNVIDPADRATVEGIDLTGSYIGTGWSSNPRITTVTKIGTGWFSCDRILSSGNNIGAVFAIQNATLLIMPDQPGPFGNVNTTADGAGGVLTPTGFKWTVFIGCCGNFGPIDFVKQ